MMSTEAETNTMELHKISGIVPETLNLLSLWQPGMSAAELRDQATRSNALAKASASRVKDIFMEGFAKRSLRPDERPAASLKAFLAAGARLPQLRQLFLLHTLRNQAILRDYLLKVYWPCVQAGRDRVEKAESMQFLRDAFDSEKIPGKWSQPTIDRVTQGIFKCLEDFGLFVKRRIDSRDIADFHIAPLTALYIAYHIGMPNELTDKVALVTGGSQGIGYAIAEALLDEGAKVYICGRDAATVKRAVAKLAGTGRSDRVDGVAADVRLYEDCRMVVAQAAKRFGGLDILVNNAGIGIFKPVDQLTPAEWVATIETNLSAVFYCSREAIPLMRRRGGGYILNISSLAAVNTFPGGSAYNASKFGLNGFTEAMMQDVRYDGIRVSTIMPGSVATDFGADPGANPKEAWKLPPEDIARAVVDLCRYPRGSLASRIELRPSQPPRK